LRDGIGAAVIGTGFIGTVHVDALRRLGIPVCGVLGSSPERGARGAQALGISRAYATLEELLADPKAQVVHVTSPNALHYPQVKAILAAGRHVICEKPLAMTSAQSAEMVDLAQASGRVAAVCYNIRFYPLNQHAQAMEGLRDARLITGHYHQDWLSRPSDWNWRLDAAEGGALRSVGDIGTHWVDLVSFISGQRVTSVMADLFTAHPIRQKPTGPVETFAATTGASLPQRIETDDAATLLLRFSGGARGALTTSQISVGRKNALTWEISAPETSAAWNSETPDHLWIGHRAAPNQILQRDAGLMNATGAAAAHLPGGHVEGFADSFRALFAQVYADVARGGRSADATYAGFDDGHHEMQFCDAVLASARERRWVDLGETA
jgi:predicted dehydrogenase